MLGRFSQEKRYDWVVSELGSRLKKEGVRLIIFGGAVTATQKSYMNRVRSEAVKVGLNVSDSPDNGDVALVPNASREAINRTMDRAKVFLHATINEHWGIAVAEAMARGLPVVVHKSGGAWSDLAGNGENGFGYDNAEGAVKAVLELINDNKAFNVYSRKSLKRVSELTLENFSGSIANILKKIS